MTNSLLDRVVVPVANEADARATAGALARHLDQPGSRVVAIHVLEKAGGAPDKASVEQREREAVEIFEAVEDGLAGLDVDLETEVRFGTDVAGTIVDAARQADATAIVFTPRGGSRWVKLLTGDVTSELVAESDVPIVVLPDRSEVDRDE